MTDATSGANPGGVDVRVVSPDQRDTNTGQTPGGLRRFEALESRGSDS